MQYTTREIYYRIDPLRLLTVAFTTSTNDNGPQIIRESGGLHYVIAVGGEVVCDDRGERSGYCDRRR